MSLYLVVRTIGVVQHTPDGPFEFAPGQHQPPFAAQAAQPNIRADAIHPPAVAAAGVRLSHLDYIPNLNIQWHALPSLLPEVARAALWRTGTYSLK
jgi:hypothetical protein